MLVKQNTALLVCQRKLVSMKIFRDFKNKIMEGLMIKLLFKYQWLALFKFLF